MTCSATGPDAATAGPGGAVCTRITRTVLDEVLAAARAALPRECCGLLIGRAGRVIRSAAIENVARSPTRFEMDPLGQARAERAALDAGAEVVGVYHSHPIGDPAPSAADRDGILWHDLPPFLHLIVTPDGRWAAFDSHGGAWSRVDLAIERPG